MLKPLPYRSIHPHHTDFPVIRGIRGIHIPLFEDPVLSEVQGLFSRFKL